MTFVHPLLLSGLVLIGVPILVHLIPMDTSVSFDKALMEYLLQRQKRF